MVCMQLDPLRYLVDDGGDLLRHVDHNSAIKEEKGNPLVNCHTLSHRRRR